MRSVEKYGIRPALILLSIALLGLFGCAVSDGVLGGSYPSETQVEQASFSLINQDRATQGLSQLTLDPQLSAVARAHSQDMRDRGYFAHVTPDGKTLTQRLSSDGVTFVIAGENLARTTDMTDPAQFANTSFLNDADHRAVLLNNKFTRVGVGVARSGNTYWLTEDFIDP